MPIELSVQFTTQDDQPDSPIQVSVCRPDQGIFPNPWSYTPPLGDEELNLLRWYLEEYIAYPDPSEQQRADEIRRQLQAWGYRLLESILGPDDALRMWQRFLDEPADRRLLTIDATDPRILRLPWELLADPERSSHLFSHKVIIRRRLHRAIVPAPSRTFELPVRVLIVVARPDDAPFIDPRAIARPLLDELDKTGDRVFTEFLFPPTLLALSDRLSDPTAPEVHIVHFDGHGQYDTVRGEGCLLFETANGKSDPVAAQKLGNLLFDCGVALMVLNACRSATQAETNPFASIAARLVQAGVGSVVAMNYSVSVQAAQYFVKAFYNNLADSQTVGGAVDAARRSLLAETTRRTIITVNDYGEVIEMPVDIHDWFIPALYQQAQDPRVFTEGAQPLSRDPWELPVALRDVGEGPGGIKDPQHGFVGRARELQTLERKLSNRAVVVLHGMAGAGKTALAIEAARWFYRTGRFKAGAYVSFEHGGSLAQLCLNVGKDVSGDKDFALDDGDPVQQVAALLRDMPALVVLDSFEAALGPDPVLPPEELATILDAAWTWALAGLETGQTPTGAWGTRVMIGTRTPDLPDTRFLPSQRCYHLAVHGLDHDLPRRHEASRELAERVIDNLYIDKSHIHPRALDELLDYLGHHPLSLCLVLPHLKMYPPGELISRFETLLPQFVIAGGRERTYNLVASLEYSLNRLTEDVRNLITALGVFKSGMFEDNLLAVTEFEPDAWQAARQELTREALLEITRVPGADHPFLRFHPTLLPYLSARLDADRRVALEARFWAHYDSFADRLYNIPARQRNEARQMARLEAFNLRWAVALLQRATEDGNAEPDQAAKLADTVDDLLVDAPGPYGR